MSKDLLQSFQKRSWESMLSTGIQRALAEMSQTLTDPAMTIKFEAVNLPDIIKSQHNSLVAVKEKETHQVPLKVNTEVQLHFDSTQGQTNAAQVVSVINLPVMSDMGFVIDGTRYEYVSGFTSASGWYFLEEERPFKKPLRYVDLKPVGNGKLTFKVFKNKVYVARDNKRKIEISIFLKALFNKSFSELKEMFSSLSPEMVAAFSIPEESYTSCCKKVVTSLIHANATGNEAEMVARIQKFFFSGEQYVLGKEAQPRLESYLSFSRVIGLEVSRAVEGIDAGEILTSAKIEYLESRDVKTIYVKDKQGTEHRINRYDISDELTLTTFLAVIEAYSQFLQGIGEPINRDSYGSKIVESIENLYLRHIRTNIEAIKKHVKDKVKTEEQPLDEILMINGKGFLQRKEFRGNRPIFNPDIISKDLKDSSLAQVSEETNTITSLDKGNKISSTLKNSSKAARGIQADQYGRTDPVAATESKTIGENHSLALDSGIDEYGFLTAKYCNVATREFENINAIQERNKPIVRDIHKYTKLYKKYSEDTTKKFTMKARVNGEVKNVLVQDVMYCEANNAQVISTLLSTVPYIENDYGKRALMAGNMAKQAVPLTKGERPWVTTGVESLQNISITTAGDLTEKAIIDNIVDVADIEKEKETAVVDWVSSTPSEGQTLYNFKVTLTDNRELFVEYRAATFQANMKGTSLHYRLNTSGPWSGNQIVIARSDIDLAKYLFDVDKIDYGPLTQYPIEAAERMGIAVGTNLKVLFKSQEGYGYEDAVYISEDLIHDKRMTHSSIYEYTAEIEDTSKYGSDDLTGETFTNNLPVNVFSEEVLNEKGEVVSYTPKVETSIISYLNSQGLPKVGTELQGGQIIIGKSKFVKSRSKNIKGEAVISDSSLRLEDNMTGTVIYSGFTRDGKTAIVHVASMLDMQTGDKVSGRHGNKGVIARVARREDLPFMEDGTVPDIVLNPLGVPSRMNIGQLLEALSGWISDQTKIIQIAECFKPGNTQIARDKAEALGIKSVRVFDGISGVPYDREMYYGVMYMYRLEHLVQNKVAGIGLQESRINPVTEQPVKGSSKGGGQKVGEQLHHSILSYGAYKVANELRGLMSDDVASQKKWKRSILGTSRNEETGEIDFSKIKVNSSDQSDKIIIPYLRAFGATVESDENGHLGIKPLTDKEVLSICTESNKLNHTYDPIIEELHNPKIFSSGIEMDSPLGRKEARQTYAYLDIAPYNVVHPMFLNSKDFLNNFFIIYNPGRDKNGGGKDKYIPLTPNMVKSIIQRNLFLVEETLNPVTFDRPVTAFRLTKLGHMKANSLTGIEGLVKMFKDYDFAFTELSMEEVGQIVLVDEDTEEFLGQESIDAIKNDNIEIPDLDLIELQESNIVTFDKKIALHQIRENYLKFKDILESKEFLVSKLIVLPAGLRPTDLKEMSGVKSSNADLLYIELVGAVRKLHEDSGGMQKEYDGTQNLTGIYTALEKIYGVGGHFKGTDDISLYNELTNHSNKNARIRDHALGKRTHFSGRSVITVNPNLDTEHAGIPFYIAMRCNALFLPKVLENAGEEIPLLNGDALTEGAMKEFIKVMTNGNLEEFGQFCFNSEDIYSKYAKARKWVKDQLQEFIKDRIVLLNREPSLHKFSIQAFHPVIVDTMSIQICPLVCSGFNADFDGDQMAAFFLQTDEAIEEAKEKMMPYKNIVNPGNSNIILNHAQDMVLGVYYATMEKNNRLNPVTTGKLLEVVKDSADEFKKHLAELNHPHLEELFNTYLTTDDPHTKVEVSKEFCRDYGRINTLPPKHTLTEEKQSKFLYKELTVPKATYTSINNMYENYLDGFIGIHDYVNYVRDINGTQYRYKDTVGRLVFNSMFYPTDDLTNRDLDLALDFGQGDMFTDNPQLQTSEHDVLEYALEINSIVNKKGLQKLNREFYDKYIDSPEIVVSMFNRVKEFAFRVADKSGVSIYLYDFDSSYDAQTRVVETQKDVDYINEMYSIGAISEQEKKAEVIALWRECRKTVEEEIKDGLDRDNNLFIIIDSGSRGSADQFMETMGIIGVVTDVNGEPFENPISTNYVNGLDPWNYMDSSHITRDGQISTALGTAESGYLTRRIVMLLQSIVVVNPQDEGEQPEEPPTYCDSEGRYFELEYETNIDTKYVVPNPNLPEGEDSDYNKYKDMLGDRGTLNDEAIEVILKENIKTVYSPSGKAIKVKRKLHPMYASLVLNRHTKEDPLTGEPSILDEDTVKFLESDEFFSTSREGKPKLHMYTTLDCNVVDGVCQKCYGLGFDEKGYPSVGHSVGFEAAQAIGEPSNQLTMSRFHAGASGNVAKDGVKGLIQMVEQSDSVDSQLQIYSKATGRVEISYSDEKTYINVITDKGERVSHPVKELGLVMVDDDEYVELGQQLTTGIKDYSTRSFYTELPDMQIEMLKDYTDLYRKSNISVHARHFELIVKRQTQFGIVLRSGKSDYHMGDIVSLNELENFNRTQENESDKVVYKPRTYGKTKVMNYGNSPLSAIADQRMKDRIVPSIVKKQKDTLTAPISRMTSGNPVGTQKVTKTFESKPTIKKRMDENVNEIIVSKDTPMVKPKSTLGEVDTKSKTFKKSEVMKEFKAPDIQTPKPEFNIDAIADTVKAPTLEDWNTPLADKTKVESEPVLSVPGSKTVVDIDTDRIRREYEELGFKL